LHENDNEHSDYTDTEYCGMTQV